jgi:microcystin-dependent protein
MNFIDTVQFPTYVMPISAATQHIYENFQTVAERFQQDIRIFNIVSATGVIPISGNINDMVISISGAANQYYNLSTSAPYTSAGWVSISPVFGDLAYDNLTTTIYEFIGTSWEIIEQPGDIRIEAVGAPINGWLYCDAASYATSAYPNLFAKIGYTHGGSGGFFNVPDLQARVPIGQTIGAMNTDDIGRTLTTRTIGQRTGEEVHLLSIPEMPAHSHTYENIGGSATSVGGGGAFDNENLAFTDPTGSSQVHNNMQPSTVLAYFIRY